MSFYEITANSEQLAILSQALERYCDAHGIKDDEGRDNIAYEIMGLYSRGITSADEIVSALEKIAADNARRRV